MTSVLMVIKDDGPRVCVWMMEDDLDVDSAIEHVEAGVVMEVSVHFEKTESRNSRMSELR